MIARASMIPGQIEFICFVLASQMHTNIHRIVDPKEDKAEDIENNA